MRQNLEEWERVISAAAELQNLIPGCVLVGGSATAIHAKHGLSTKEFRLRWIVGKTYQISATESQQFCPVF